MAAEYPYTYTLNESSDEPIMMIDTHIGHDEADGPGIIGNVFQRELLHLDTLGKKRIQVWINSPGGSVTDGYAMYNAIQMSKTPVDTYVYGIAASMAAVLFQAGRRRSMSDFSMLMYHDPFGSDDEGLLSAMRDTLINMICNRCGFDKNAMSNMMARTTYVLSDEALELNLCDSIMKSEDLNKPRLNMAKSSVKDYWNASKSVINSLLNNQKNMPLNRVCNRLKLTTDASEDSILAAIDQVENRAVKAEAELTAVNKKSASDLEEMENKIKDSESALNAMKDERDALKNKLEEAEKEKQDAETKAKKEKAKNLIAANVKNGKISKDDAAEWEADAVENYDRIKNRLDKLPLNKKAVHFNTDQDTKEDSKANDIKNSLGASVAADMLAIKNKMQGLK